MINLNSKLFEPRNGHHTLHKWVQKFWSISVYDSINNPQQKGNNIKDRPNQATEFANWSFLGKDWITAGGGVSARSRSALFFFSSAFKRWTSFRRLCKSSCWSRTRCWAAAWFVKASRCARIPWISAGERSSAERTRRRGCKVVEPARRASWRRVSWRCASSARLMRTTTLLADFFASSRNLNRLFWANRKAKKQPSRFYVWRE